MFEFMKLKDIEKYSFYQAKYQYYRKFNLYGFAAFCCVFIILFVTEISDNITITVSSLLIRCLVLIPYAALAFLDRYYKDYRILSIISHVLAHTIILTSMDLVILNQSPATAPINFIFMGYLLLIASFCAPPGYSVISQWLLLIEILIASKLMHIDNFYLLFIYAFQVVLMLNIISIFVTKLFHDNYLKTRKLDYITFHDQLTDVYNRNMIRRLVNKEERFNFTKNPLCILLLDIDYFKKVNDTFGHDQGDVILKRVAKTITETLSVKSYCLRWGGEEFLVLLEGCELNEGVEKAEEIRKKIEGIHDLVCPITISIGVSLYAGEEYLHSVKNSDQALYKAKAGGRNQVQTYKHQPFTDSITSYK